MRSLIKIKMLCEIKTGKSFNDRNSSSSMTQKVNSSRIGIDIGGTFTDLFCITADNEVWTTKLLTTSADPSLGFLSILDSALSVHSEGSESKSVTEVREIIHATTVATNAILEGKTAKMGLITTAGFRDVLEIGRHFRRDIYNLFLEKPPVLIQRHLRLEVHERIDSQGRIIEAVNEEDILEAKEMLLKEGVEVILVCFINSYANPEHERHAARILRENCEIPVIASHALCWEYREFERFSTAAVHGAVTPLVRNYLERIQSGLKTRDISAPLSVMQSNAGIARVHTVEEQPASIVESGPAAGVISCIEVGRRLGFENIICFDMGGTTAKAALIRNNRVEVKTDFEVGGGLQGGFGSGYPLLTPVVDLVEIGTGGGSICFIDEAGHLKVGPRSAGAEPGPACYGRGGREPTISDAHAVLGRLRSECFAGGHFNLDIEASRVSIAINIAKAGEMELNQAAEGIIAVANAQMVRALQLISVQRGYDPKEFVLVAFGGAGPMHAAELAFEIGCPTVIIPPEAGVQSARGLLVADARRDFSRVIVSSKGTFDLMVLQSQYDSLIKEGTEDLLEAGFSEGEIEYRIGIDTRYEGQDFEITVERPAPNHFDLEFISLIERDFHAAHQRLYGHSEPHSKVEWKILRATIIGLVPSMPRMHLGSKSTSLVSRKHSVQGVVWGGDSLDSTVYERSSLGAGDSIVGPSLILQVDTTIVVPPGFVANVAETGDILLTKKGASHNGKD